LTGPRAALVGAPPAAGRHGGADTSTPVPMTAVFGLWNPVIAGVEMRFSPTKGLRGLL